MLNDYAKRITSVSARMSNLVNRLNYLCRIDDEYELIRIMKYASLDFYDIKLQYCQMYLQDTANDFKKIEDALSSCDPLRFDLVNSVLNPYSFNLKDTSFVDAVTSTLGIDEYIEIIKSDSSIVEKKDAVIKWLSSIESDASQLKKYYEWIKNNGKVDWPEPLKSGFDFIEAIDTSNNIISGTLGYLYGIYQNDNEVITDSGEKLLDASFSIFKDMESVESLFNTPGQITGFRNSIILSYGKNMVQNFLESIQENDKVSEVYWDIFATSGVDVYYDVVCNSPTLAIAYLPAKALTAMVGYDMQAAYEEVSDKKGFAAVIDSVGRLYSEIKENSSWENWKSGMGIMIDGVKDGIVGGFNSLKNGISGFFDSIF